MRIAVTSLLFLISLLRQLPNLLGSGLPGDHSSRKLTVKDIAPNSPLYLSLLTKPVSPSSFLDVSFITQNA